MAIIVNDTYSVFSGNDTFAGILLSLGITKQPLAQNFISGQALTFSITAEGTGTLTFQWQKNGVNIGGATSALYTTPNLTIADDQNAYRCIVDNGSSSITSIAVRATYTVADVTPPTLSGVLAYSNVTQTSYTLTWPAGADNVAVTGYEYSLDGGTTYASAGNVLTKNITGRTQGTTDQVRVRAFDAAGNRSPALSNSVPLLQAPYTLTSATINTAGTQISLLFNGSVSVGAGGNGGVTIAMSGGGVTASYVSGAGSNTLVYGLSRTVYLNETGTMNYTQPGNGFENTTSGVDISSISARAITNSSTYNQLPIFTQATPPGGTESIFYAYQFIATYAVNYVLGSGAFPTGTTIDSNGNLTGYPTPGDYTFTVDAINPGGGVTHSATKSVSIAASSGGSNSSLLAIYPLSSAYIEAAGADMAYTGQTLIGTYDTNGNQLTNDSVIRFQPYGSVLNTGMPGALRRIKYGDPPSSGSGNRCENSWDTITSTTGDEIYDAFAINPNVNEFFNTAVSGTSDMLFYQIHQETGPYTPGPTFAIGVSGATGKLFITKVSGGQAGTETNIDNGTTFAPTPGVWTRFIVNVIFNPSGTGTARIRVWMNDVLIVNLSGSAAAIGQTTSGGAAIHYYSRLGFYKWTYSATSNWGPNSSYYTRAAYFSWLYGEKNTGSLAKAQALLAAFAVISLTPSWSNTINGGTIATVTDSGSGQQVQEHTITNSIYPSDQEVRAENGYWDDATHGLMPQGVIQTYGFGLWMDATDKITSSSQDVSLLVQQNHFNGNGDTQPPIALFLSGQDMSLKWRIAYNTKPQQQWQVNGGQYRDYEQTNVVSSESLIPVSTWYFYIVEVRPHWDITQNPYTKILVSRGGAPYVQIVNDIGPNSYNKGNIVTDDEYLRKGPYKWVGSVWGRNRYKFRLTPLLSAQGSSVAAIRAALIRFGGATT